MVLYKTSIVCKEGTNWSKTLQSKSCASCKMLAAGKRHNFYFEVLFHYCCTCWAVGNCLWRSWCLPCKPWNKIVWDQSIHTEVFSAASYTSFQPKSHSDWQKITSCIFQIYFSLFSCGSKAVTSPAWLDTKECSRFDKYNQYSCSNKYHLVGKISLDTQTPTMHVLLCLWLDCLPTMSLESILVQKIV